MTTYNIRKWQRNLNVFFFWFWGFCLGLSALFGTLMTWQPKIKTITLLTLPEWWIRLIIIIIYYYYYYYYHYYYCYHHHSLLCTVNVDPRIRVSYSMCSLCQINDFRQKASFAELYIMIVLAVPESADFCKDETCSLIPSLSRWCETCIIIMYITNTIIINVFGQISKKFEPSDKIQ